MWSQTTKKFVINLCGIKFWLTDLLYGHLTLPLTQSFLLLCAGETNFTLPLTQLWHMTQLWPLTLIVLRGDKLHQFLVDWKPGAFGADRDGEVRGKFFTDVSGEQQLVDKVAGAGGDLLEISDNHFSLDMKSWEVSSPHFVVFTWPCGKLPFECQKIAKNLTFFSKKLQKNVHFFQKNGNFPEGQLVWSILWAVHSFTYWSPNS